MPDCRDAVMPGQLPIHNITTHSVVLLDCRQVGISMCDFIEYSNVRHVVLSGVGISFTLSHRVHNMLLGYYAGLSGCRNAGATSNS